MAVELRLANTPSIKNILRPIKTRRDVGVFLGLNPHAESYHPFGIKSDNPSWDIASLALVRKIDSTSPNEHEDEQEHERSARGSMRFRPGEPRLVHESLDKHGKGSDDRHYKIHQCARNHPGPVFCGGLQGLADDFFGRHK